MGQIGCGLMVVRAGLPGLLHVFLPVFGVIQSGTKGRAGRRRRGRGGPERAGVGWVCPGPKTGPGFLPVFSPPPHLSGTNPLRAPIPRQLRSNSET